MCCERGSTGAEKLLIRGTSPETKKSAEDMMFKRIFPNFQ